jgi:hypothetical protein
MNPQVAWRLTPWEFRCLEIGYWKGKHCALVALLRGIGGGEKLRSGELLRILLGVVEEEKDWSEDEAFAASEERAYRAEMERLARHG